jgi:Leucine-rich repeat (LRR) protein
MTVLILSNNKIRKLDENIICLRQLKTLDIGNNDLQDIPSAIGFITSLVRINLEGNPLKCIRSNIKQGGAEVLKKYLKQRVDPDTAKKL